MRCATLTLNQVKPTIDFTVEYNKIVMYTSYADATDNDHGMSQQSGILLYQEHFSQKLKQNEKKSSKLISKKDGTSIK
jgi:hypothetical protein